LFRDHIWQNESDLVFYWQENNARSKYVASKQTADTCWISAYPLLSLGSIAATVDSSGLPKYGKARFCLSGSRQTPFQIATEKTVKLV